MKKCSNKNCKQANPQPLDSFHKNHARYDGLANVCKKCCAELDKSSDRKAKKKLYRQAYRKTLKGKAYRQKERLLGKDKRKLNYLKYTYGIKNEEYIDMLVKQNCKCAICGVASTLKKLAVDHSHSSGQVRGLLCNKCNSGLGFFKDNLESLKNAIKYLENQ